ncbi:MAG: SUF system NifU family Fe-S cluster assembly protein [Herpetosiphon sp.]
MDEVRENIEDHFSHPHNQGNLPGATVQQRELNPLCGDRIMVYLQHDGDTITAMMWEGRGCTISQAAASMLSDELVGQRIADVQTWNHDLMTGLLGVPLNPARMKCATLGLKAVQNALIGVQS